MYTIPFTLIKERIELKLPQIKQIELYAGQDLPNSEGNIVYTSPAVFIRFNPTDLKDLLNGYQHGIMTFDVILLSEDLSSHNKRFTNLSTGSHFNLIDMLFLTLDKWSALLSGIKTFQAFAGTKKDYQVLNSLNRTRVNYEHGNSAIMKTTQTFSAMLVDSPHSRIFEKFAPNLEVISKTFTV